MSTAAFRQSQGDGRIVRSRTNELGPGKLISASDDRATIEYFLSPGHRVQREVPAASLVPVRLAPQTRCYLRSEDGRWHTGRIGERYDADYEVNLPDRASFYITEPYLYVRCALLLDDPVETLAVKGHETARFHDARSAVVKALLRQRAASRGMTGLSSARIELFSHQVEVVRRVLEDPIQRYLLADEVGLGKTVEAGVIIRQFLLDETDGRVLVLVPPLLIDQWNRELDTRFRAFDTGRVDLLSTAELERIREAAPYRLVVLDEAHHIAADAYADSASARDRFDCCRRVAHRAERVLLLSATPAASHETQFLAMLHLLDPATYRLEDRDAFQERVRNRQEIGHLLLAINESQRPFALKLALRRLRQVFEADETVQRLARELEESLVQAPEDVDGRAAAIRAIRTHVSETYRLHRRMLRNRRDALNDSIASRTSFPVEIHWDTSDRTHEIYDLLDEWRAIAGDAWRAAAEVGDESGGRVWALAFAALAEAAGSSATALATLVRARLGEGDATTELESDAVERLREPPVLGGERPVLERLLSVLTDGHPDGRIAWVTSVLRGIRERAGTATLPKCLVFAGPTSTARTLAEELTRAFGSRAVARYICGLPSQVIDEGVHRFAQGHDCFVLVCDSSAEEGRNFQFVRHLIHADLPWEPNRLEQRIGRADRIGRVADLTSHVLLGLPGDASLAAAWYRTLAEGFGVFEGSIASLQFYVDSILPRLHALVLSDGASGLLGALAHMRDEMKSERVRVEEQAAIDEIDTRDTPATAFAEALDSADAEYEHLREAVEGWFCRELLVDRDPPERGAKIVRYQATPKTLIPRDVLRARFDAQFAKRCTYDRPVASRDPGVALLRPGHPLIDALAEYVRWDDRGRAFAIWRVDSEWSPASGNDWAGFRFDLVVEADTTSAREVLSRMGGPSVTRQALERRADALLPPWATTVFIDLDMLEVSDAPLLTRLRRRYASAEKGGTDYNLTKSRLSVIDSILPPGQWEAVCREACVAAIEAVHRRATFQERCQSHAALATRKAEQMWDQLRLRSRGVGAVASGDRSAVRELELEEQLGTALIAGVLKPQVIVDAAGFLVLSGQGPAQGESDTAQIGGQ